MKSQIMPQHLTQTTNNTLFLLCIFVYTLFLSWMLFFGQGIGEHDLFQVAGSIVYSLKTGEAITSISYSPQIQPLLPYLLHPIATFFVNDVHDAFLLLNIIGSICFLSIPILFWLLLRNCFKDDGQAKFAVVLLITSPVFIFLAGFGHGFHIAISLSLASFWIFFKSIEFENSNTKLLGLLLSILIQSLAFLIRFEQVLLFWSLIVALMIFSNRKKLSDWFALGVIFSVSIIGLVVGRKLLIPEITGISNTFNTVGSAIQAILHFISIESVISCFPKWLAEVGLPLLFLSIYLSWKKFKDKQWLIVIGAGMAILPSFIIYFGNPTPTRHGIIAAIGCAVFIARYWDWSFKEKLLPAIAAILLVINLILPWGLILIDGKEYPDRRNVTYNVFQRVERNQIQIEKSFNFFPEIVNNAESDTLYIGMWPNVSQFAAFLVDTPDITWERYVLTKELYGFKMYDSQKSFVLIEAYSEDQVKEAKTMLNNKYPGLKTISVIPNTQQHNDIKLDIPKEMDWWNN